MKSIRVVVIKDTTDLKHPFYGVYKDSWWQRHVLAGGYITGSSSKEEAVEKARQILEGSKTVVERLTFSIKEDNDL